uniref:Grain length protein n=1 Tax=Oryza sativa TaxID=4530 RepID=M5AX63_ORYSA|nr:GS3-5 protein [Oryza sativa Japonica Group]BAN13399.1 grain length protein [Oryza sativa]BAN13404.1 grain length protein [Oryza sativa]
MAMAAAPRPKSPPAPPDPCGRHRLQLAVDALHREIGFLEGEINSIEGIHAASRCCREVDEFIGRTPDPFITISSEKRSHDHSHHFLKKFRCLCRASACCLSYLSWICCCSSAHPPPPPPSTSRGRAAAATATATAAPPPPPHVGRR